jgi:hypothetical protein
VCDGCVDLAVLVANGRAEINRARTSAVLTASACLMLVAWYFLISLLVSLYQDNNVDLVTLPVVAYENTCKTVAVGKRGPYMLGCSWYFH